MLARWTLPLALAFVLVACGGGRPTRDPVPDASPGALEGLEWLAGAWVEVSEGRTTRETWAPPDAGVMLGTSQTVQGGLTVGWEQLRIEATPDGVVLFASPNGRHPPTPFPMVLLEPGRVAFENLAHDFPQRVTYWRDGPRLHARVEGVVKGTARSMAWVFQPAPPAN